MPGIGDEIMRFKDYQQATLSTADPPTGTAIDYRHWIAGGVYCSSDIASTTLTFYGAYEQSGVTYVPIIDAAGAAATSTKAAGVSGCEIPAACAPWPWLKIKSSGDNGETVYIVRTT